MDQIAALASQQVASDNPQPQVAQQQTTPAQAVGTNNIVQPEVHSAVSQSVPYDRFREVIQQKNQLAQEVEQYRAQMAQSQYQPQQTMQQQTPQINSVDDLINVVRSDVKSEIRRELEQAYQTRLKPMEDRITRTDLVTNVERFYAGNPDASKVRGQIDQYFDTLPPTHQNFIKDSITRGDSSVMNNLYYAVIAQNRTQSNQVVQQAVQQQAQMASMPSPYMTMQSTPLSFQDKINQASKGGAYGGRNTDGWEGVFADVLKSSS